MEVKTFADLIDWTRQLHHHLAQCFAECASEHQTEKGRFLLDYLAEHEAQMEKMVLAFELKADPKMLHTYIYDYLSHTPIVTHRTCNKPYAILSFDDICKEVFDYHQQIIELYRDLSAKADIPEAIETLQELLKMEEHEVMRMARESGRMYDI
jgi:GTP-binding protein EngB required for normal cell division